MTRYITGILILLLVSVATSQAQRKEPEIKACERQIEKLKKAPDNVTFARELYNTGIYCLDRGMYDEAALLASLAAAFNAQDIDSISKLLLPALIQSFSFKEEDMKYSDDVAKSSENAYSRLAKAYTLTAEGMKHNACLRGYAEQIFKSSFSQYRLADNDYMYAVAHTLLGDYYIPSKIFSYNRFGINREFHTVILQRTDILC